MSTIYKQNSPEFLFAYAETLKKCNSDVLKTNSLWEWCLESGHDWESCSNYESLLSTSSWYQHIIFRLKPKTITINGIEVPAPLSKHLNAGDIYYGIGQHGPIREQWVHGLNDLSSLALGRVFESESDAERVFNAITQVLTGEA